MAHLHLHASRRDFLRRAGTASALAGTPFMANLMAIGAASGQQAAGYKALVCIFLNGGNDQSNTIIPASGSALAAYTQSRPTIALPASQMLAVSPTGYAGPPLALHPSLAALRPLFEQSRVAILANVGTLSTPTTPTPTSTSARCSATASATRCSSRARKRRGRVCASRTTFCKPPVRACSRRITSPVPRAGGRCSTCNRPRRKSARRRGT